MFACQAAVPRVTGDVVRLDSPMQCAANYAGPRGGRHPIAADRLHRVGHLFAPDLAGAGGCLTEPRGQPAWPRLAEMAAGVNPRAGSVSEMAWPSASTQARSTVVISHLCREPLDDSQHRLIMGSR